MHFCLTRHLHITLKQSAMFFIFIRCGARTSMSTCYRRQITKGKFTLNNGKISFWKLKYLNIKLYYQCCCNQTFSPDFRPRWSPHQPFVLYLSEKSPCAHLQRCFPKHKYALYISSTQQMHQVILHLSDVTFTDCIVVAMLVY